MQLPSINQYENFVVICFTQNVQEHRTCTRVTVLVSVRALYRSNGRLLQAVGPELLTMLSKFGSRSWQLCRSTSSMYLHVRSTFRPFDYGLLMWASHWPFADVEHVGILCRFANRHQTGRTAQSFLNVQLNTMYSSNGICAAVKACLCSEELRIY